jgi:hypothetical protein
MQYQNVLAPGELRDQHLYSFSFWRNTMRTMIRLTIPVEAGNRAFRDGSLPKTMMELIERLKPEAAYFFPDRGVRTALMVVDLKDPSDIPAIAEPLFESLNAAVEFLPVMNAEDLKKGIARTK